MKKCSTCKEIKTESSFRKNRSHADGLHHQCSECAKLQSKKRPKRDRHEYFKKWEANHPNYHKSEWINAYQKNHHQERKQWLDDYKSKLSCAICGENNPACLDFHHNDPSQKEITVGQRFYTRTIERILEEIKKCTVLCANCHRKHHFNQRHLDQTKNGHANLEDLATPHQYVMQ